MFTIEPIFANAENPLVWIAVLVVIFLLFGHKLPQVARSFGTSFGEFKKGIKSGEEEAAAEEKKEPEKVEVKK